MKIAIGSAQFGMDYGVSNKYGKSDKSEVLKIVRYAYKNGVNLIDTAPSYGHSEKTLGEVINNQNWKIITKTPIFSDNYFDKSHSQYLRKSFYQSLSNLGQKNIYGFLIHSCEDLLKPGGKLLFQQMESLKAVGIIKKIGVSVYNSNQIESILEKYDIDIIQLPINIFDQHLFLDGWLDKLKNNNIEIHARSVFLQGLLLMQPEAIPKYFLPIKEKIELFSESARNLSLSKLELALAYVNGISEIDSIIVGVNTVTQFQEIINANKIKVEPLDFIENSTKNPKFTQPSLWKM